MLPCRETPPSALIFAAFPSGGSHLRILWHGTDGEDLLGSRAATMSRSCRYLVMKLIVVSGLWNSSSWIARLLAHQIAHSVTRTRAISCWFKESKSENSQRRVNAIDLPWPWAAAPAVGEWPLLNRAESPGLFPLDQAKSELNGLAAQGHRSPGSRLRMLWFRFFLF